MAMVVPLTQAAMTDPGTRVAMVDSGTPWALTRIRHWPKVNNDRWACHTPSWQACHIPL